SVIPAVLVPDSTARRTLLFLLGGAKVLVVAASRTARWLRRTTVDPNRAAADSSPVLRVDNRLELVRLPWSLPRMFKCRYTVQSGKRILDIRWKQPAFEATKAAQQNDPVALLREGRRMLWYFHDCLYWEDEGLDG